MSSESEPNKDIPESEELEESSGLKKHLLGLATVTVLCVMAVIGIKKGMSISYKILESKAQPIKTDSGKPGKYIAIPTQWGYPVHVYFTEAGVYMIGPNGTEVLDKDRDGNIEVVQNLRRGVAIVDNDDDGTADEMVGENGEMVPVDSEMNQQFERVKSDTKKDVVSAALSIVF